MLADRFWVVIQEFLGNRIAVPSAANSALVINALDNLTGSGDLISVRNRGTFTPALHPGWSRSGSRPSAPSARRSRS